MAKRFSRYKWALKELEGNVPADSSLDLYKQYRAGTRVPNYGARDTNSLPGSMREMIIAPFATAPGDKYYTQMSQRAFDKMGDLVSLVPKGLFNHQDKGSDVPIMNPGFIPAKATIATASTGSAPEPSKITGKSYKKRNGVASYTIPFGGTLVNGDSRIFLNVAKAIVGSVETKNSAYTVSISPEMFYLR